MHIKLTEYVQTTTLTLNIKDAPMTALPLIKDAFAKLATDLEELYDSEVRGPSGMTYKEAQKVRNAAASRLAEMVAGDVMQPVSLGELLVPVMADTPDNTAVEPKRRGRPPKVKVGEPAPAVEPTPLEQAIAKVEDEQSQGELSQEPTSQALGQPETRSSENENPAPIGAGTADASTATGTTEPVSDSDLQKYCVKLAQHYSGPQKVFDLAKQFVEEGAVPRPSNIKGDDKRWQFIKAVEADSGVKYHG